MLLNAGFSAQQIVFFGKIGRVASEEVIIQLILSKCMLILMYAPEACCLKQI